MNPILNKLYFIYKDLSETIYNNNKLIGESLSEFTIQIDTTLNKIKTIRDLLVKKDYSTADNLSTSLNFDPKILQSISQLINDLRLNNTDYDLSAGLENNMYKLIIDKLIHIESNIDTLTTSKALPIPNEKIQTNSQEINPMIDQTNRLSDNLESLNNKISNLQNNIKVIDSTLNSHLDTINSDFTQVILSYKDQAITTITNIKNTTLDTSSMITKELPIQIKQITDTIPDKINITIKKSLWPNLSLFGSIAIVFILGSIWIMGRTMGHTITSNLTTIVAKPPALKLNNK